MISISLQDSNGNQLNLNDVVLLHYTNPNVKYLGVLQYNQEEARLIISDGDNDCEYWPHNDYTTTEKVCDGGFAFSLDHYFGRNETEKQTKEMMKMVEEVKKALYV